MTDDMDRLLSQLPYTPPPPDLIPRICRLARARQRRNQRLRLTFIGFFALSGVWFIAIPLLQWSYSLSLPASGPQLLLEIGKIALNDMETSLALGLQNLTMYQQEVITQFGVLAFLGLSLLMVSTLLGLNQLLPRSSLTYPSSYLRNAKGDV
ncbi:MAG: hypothetical protein AB1345_00595 [Chloroflexota bacterium]